MLGIVASFAGLLLGDLLSRTLFDRVPAYLAFAFPIGTRADGGHGDRRARVRRRRARLVCSRRCRRCSTCDAGRAVDASSARPARARRGERDRATRTARALLVGAPLAIAPRDADRAARPGLDDARRSVALAFVRLCLIPAAFTARDPACSTRLSRRIARQHAAVAVMELRATTHALDRARRRRRVGGLRQRRGRGRASRSRARARRNFGQYLATADLWVTTGGDDLTTTASTPAACPRASRARPGSPSVRATKAGCWTPTAGACGSSPARRATARCIPASQLREGDLAARDAARRAGRLGVRLGRAGPSRAPARRRPLDAADATGRLSLRVAAITTNLGWPPGGIVLNANDYRRAWATERPAALRGRPAAGRAARRRQAGGRAGARAGAGLRVQTLAERRRSTRRWRGRA